MERRFIDVNGASGDVRQVRGIVGQLGGGAPGDDCIYDQHTCIMMRGRGCINQSTTAPSGGARV